MSTTFIIVKKQKISTNAKVSDYHGTFHREHLCIYFASLVNAALINANGGLIHSGNVPLFTGADFIWQSAAHPAGGIA